MTVIDFKTKEQTPPEPGEKENVVAKALQAAIEDGFDNVMVIGLKNREDGQFGMTLYTSLFDPLKVLGIVDLAKANYLKSIT